MVKVINKLHEKMNYHEAKYRTLWKLAFCIVGIWNSLGKSCNFCKTTKQFFPYLNGLDAPNCDKCPVNKLCDRYTEMFTNKTRIELEIDYQYLFDQLLILEMPELPNENVDDTTKTAV